MKPVNPVFSWSWATPFFLTILVAELVIMASYTGRLAMPVGAFAFAWLFTIDDRSYANLTRARWSALCFACAFLIVFLVCGDVVSGRWANVMFWPLFGFIIAGVVVRGRSAT